VRLFFEFAGISTQALNLYITTKNLIQNVPNLIFIMQFTFGTRDALQLLIALDKLIL